MRVIVVGAGLGGLTLALSLHAVGIEAQVYEAAPEVLPLGVGINVLPHAVRELTELDLADDLARRGIATQSLMARLPGSWSASQPCMRAVSAALVSTASSSEVSR